MRKNKIRFNYLELLSNKISNDLTYLNYVFKHSPLLCVEVSRFWFRDLVLTDLVDFCEFDFVVKNIPVRYSFVL